MKEKAQKSRFTKIRQGSLAAAEVIKNRLDIGSATLVLPKQKNETKIDAKALFSVLSIISLSFILARAKMAFGTFPLGLAVVCAADRYAPFAALGAALGTLSPGGNNGVYAFSYLLAIALRACLAYFLSDKGDGKVMTRLWSAYGAAFTESLYLRMAVSIVPAFVSGAYVLAEGQFAYFDVLGMLFLMICTPAAVFVYSGAFDEGVRHTIFYPVAVSALLFSVVFSVRSVSLFGVSLGLSAAFFITMYAARGGAVLRAALFGLLVGFAIDPALAPLVALAGIVAAALSRASIGAACAAGCVFAFSVGFFSVGVRSLTSLLPASALGALIFSLLDKTGVLGEFEILKKEKVEVSVEAIEIKKGSALVSDVEEISEAFSSLSEIFLNLSEHMAMPSVMELRQICDAACDEYCPACQKRGLCWESEYTALSDMLSKLASELRTRGRVSDKNIPEHIRSRCTWLGGIIDKINRDGARAIETAVRGDRSRTVSLDYAAFSAILADALEKNQSEHSLDAATSKFLQKAFEPRSKEFPCASVTVWGERVKHIVLSGVGAAPLAKSSSALKNLIEEICEMKISDPRLEISASGTHIAFEELPRFRADSATAFSSAHGGECGDSVITFEGRRNYFYSMINDGMGSGKIAALTSQICAVFMEKLLSCGLSAEPALKMLSAVLQAKSIECSSSVDLAEFDLADGRVTFIKSGAAPSYVRRAGKLFRLASKTVPIGIMRGFDAEQIKFELEEGDVVIMLSDGVCQDFDECAWLPFLLTDGWEEDIRAMADKLVREATVNNPVRDDISVAIVKIENNR